MEQKEIIVKSTLDGSLEPSLFYSSKAEDRPLIVGLHTWSYDRFNQINNMLPLAEKYDFNLLLPNCRGANIKYNPQCKKACGSKYVIQDIKDAIDYCFENFKVYKKSVFLLGASASGQTALLTAAKYTTLFLCVGAFVPICDLAKWSAVGYEKHVNACCENDHEKQLRSPINYLDELAKANIKIFHGKYDNVVPCAQSIELYMKLIEKHPKAKTYLDIFDAGHNMDMMLAEHWIISQYQRINIAKVTG